MDPIQTAFLKFHRAIQLESIGQYRELKEKRDGILDKLRQRLRERFLGERKIPTFEFFNTGSYEMSTGIIPTKKPNHEHDYDLDVGVIFNLKKGEYDPMTVKSWVKNALLKDFDEQHVEEMRPCIRVQYIRKKKKRFHLDFAIYGLGESLSDPRKDPNQIIYLSKGFLNSSSGNKCWEEAQPFLFQEKVKKQYSNPDDLLQFRRIIRYMKRWKDLKFLGKGENAVPTGILLTVAVMNFLKLDQKVFGDNDLKALTSFIKSFSSLLKANPVVKFPFAPKNNLLDKMGSSQLEKLIKELDGLQQSLMQARQLQQQPEKSLVLLQEQFGEDFSID